MRSPQFLALRPAAGAFDSTSAGPAMTVLGTLVARIAVILRAMALAEMVVQVILWRSFYLASPRLLWGPAVALAWGGTAMACLWRHHRPRWQLLCADAAVAAAHREARDQYVVLSENIERREQDRLMHDTILNTMTAIARSGGTATAISQCRRDIALLESALGESGSAGEAGQPGLVAAIEAVVGELRARGLTVDLAVTGGAAAQGAAAECAPEPAPVPGPVTAAMAHATREALANVAAHAGTGRAQVTVGMTPPGGPAATGRIQVTIRDAGAGFDPGKVDPARLGVRRSITERVEDWGGSASVESAPGEGTTVRLCWPAAGPGGPPPGLLAAGAAAAEVPAQW